MTARVGAVRSLYRRATSFLDPGAQVAVAAWLLRLRRWLRSPFRSALIDPSTGRRPTLLVALGTANGELPRILEQLREHGGPDAVVLVTDSDAFEVLRREHVLFEYIPPEADLRLAGVEDREVFVRDRLEQLDRVYGPSRVVVADMGKAKPAQTSEFVGSHAIGASERKPRRWDLGKSS